MAEVELDTAGRFANGEKLDDEGFLSIREAEEALHGAVLRSHPLLFGSHWAEMALPRAGKPGKIGERGAAGRCGGGFLSARNGKTGPREKDRQIQSSTFSRE